MQRGFWLPQEGLDHHSDHLGAGLDNPVQADVRCIQLCIRGYSGSKDWQVAEGNLLRLQDIGCCPNKLHHNREGASCGFGSKDWQVAKGNLLITYHAALNYLLKKEKSKPQLIR